MAREDGIYLENCKFVKTVLMLMVIFGHAVALWNGNWFAEPPAIESNGLSILYALIGNFHIYAFTLTSGYIFAYKILRGGYCKYILFLRNKIKRLLVPYLFVMPIWVAPITGYFFNWDLAYMVKKYILCIDPSQLWFLWMLFWVFAIVWPMKNLILEKPALGWVIVLAFYGAGKVGARLFPNLFCIWTAFRYIVFFYAGMRIRYKEENGANSIIRKLPWFVWVITYLAIFCGLEVMEQNNGTVWKLMIVGINFLLHMVGAIMAWTSMQGLAKFVRWKNNAVFGTLSLHSMPMYLFHQQIIYVSIAVLNGRVTPWINAGVNYIVAIAGALLISMILMRWKTTRVLVGEK